MGIQVSKEELLPYEANKLYWDFVRVKDVAERFYGKDYEFLVFLYEMCGKTERLIGPSRDNWEKKLNLKPTEGWKKVIELFNVLLKRDFTVCERNQIYYDIQQAVSDSYSFNEELPFIEEEEGNLICCNFFDKIAYFQINKENLISFINDCGFNIGESSLIASEIIKTFGNVKSPVVLNETDPMTNSCECFFCWAKILEKEGGICGYPGWEATREEKLKVCCNTARYYLTTF